MTVEKTNSIINSTENKLKAAVTQYISATKAVTHSPIDQVHKNYANLFHFYKDNKNGFDYLKILTDKCKPAIELVNTLNESYTDLPLDKKTMKKLLECSKFVDLDKQITRVIDNIAFIENCKDLSFKEPENVYWGIDACMKQTQYFDSTKNQIGQISYKIIASDQQSIFDHISDYFSGLFA